LLLPEDVKNVWRLAIRDGATAGSVTGATGNPIARPEFHVPLYRAARVDLWKSW
jgi:hypothetical protein